MSAGGGQSKIVKIISPHSFLYTTRANTSHERIEQIRVCAGSTPAYKGVAGVHEVCALTEPRRWARFGKAGKGTEQSRADNPCIGTCTSAFACNRTVHSICSHRRVYIVRALAMREMAGRYLRGNVLDDFWYFWSYKSTIKRKAVISVCFQ